MLESHPGVEATWHEAAKLRARGARAKEKQHRARAHANLR
jgi:hypothetical protein